MELEQAQTTKTQSTQPSRIQEDYPKIGNDVRAQKRLAARASKPIGQREELCCASSQRIEDDEKREGPANKEHAKSKRNRERKTTRARRRRDKRNTKKDQDVANGSTRRL